jgi:hypothetical protein
MDGKRDHRWAASYRDDPFIPDYFKNKLDEALASYRDDPFIPDYIKNKLDEALEDIRRHTQQKRREEEERPRHSHSP